MPDMMSLAVISRPGANCINIGLPGKSILKDYYQEKSTSRRHFLLLRIGKTYFYTIRPWAHLLHVLHLARLLQLLQVVKQQPVRVHAAHRPRERAGPEVEGGGGGRVLQHDDVTAHVVQVDAAEEPVAVRQHRLDDAALQNTA